MTAVHFHDWRGVFQLLADSTGVPGLQVAAAEGDAPAYRRGGVGMDEMLLPGTDGACIYLPPKVDLFPDWQGNFGFCKVSLFHQLGYFEFGCFDALDRVIAALHGFAEPALARRLFAILEDSRIDWQLQRRFPGLAAQLQVQKARAATALPAIAGSRPYRLLAYLLSLGLDAPDTDWLAKGEAETARLFEREMQQLASADASLEDSLAALVRLYPLVCEGEQGEAGPPTASTAGVALVEATPRSLTSRRRWGSDGAALPLLVEFRGEVVPGVTGEGVGILIENLQRRMAALEETAAGQGGAGATLAASLAGARRRAQDFLYDEWDHQQDAYRRRWCTLHVLRDLQEDPGYVAKALAEHQALARRVRRQLASIKPERLAKVKGMPEGEELDLDRSLAYLLDRKAGLAPDDSIHIQRRPRERDVATLFLLDMSASTDDLAPGLAPEAAPEPPEDDEDDQSLASYFAARRAYEAGAKRIIDLEKQAVILMAEALEELGDSYAVCGFSGYGRERVEYYLCKDFHEPLDPRAKGRIGGIKPCRSTRMGAPIRHATRALRQTGARVKSLIVLSDGYPQDHDYGEARNSRDYGLADTMKALTEARQQGVQSYCLTVDPSGHDYLRAMCPERQYMVIQELAQLPEELSRVYCSLTA